MKVILVDDEPNAIKVLESHINNYTTGITIIGKASNKSAAISLIKNTNFDVLFLDINLGDGTGFDVLDHFDEKPFKIVFTTAYDDYAIKAFRYSAVDYLLKPVDPKLLVESIEKLNTNINNRASEQLDLIQLSLKEKTFKKIAVATTDEIHFIKINDIIRLESFKNYTDIFTLNNGKITVSKTLKYFERLLPKTDFFRSHQCHITNLNFINRFIKKDGGYLELSNGNTVPVSRRKKEDLLERLKGIF